MSYWKEVQPDLRILVEHLRPDDALTIVRRLIECEEREIEPVLIGMLRGIVTRQQDEARHSGQRPSS